jgi:hypothetical protein
MKALNLMDREQYLVNRKQQLIERKAQYEVKVAEVRAEIEEKQGKITSKELANLRYKEILFQDELNCICHKLGIEVEEEPVKEETKVECEEVVEAEQEPVEEWRDIEGYENLYQVSSFGRVKSLRKSQIIKLRKDYKEDLWGLYLYKNGKKEWHTIQYLVLKTFVGTPNDGNNYVMLHLDGHKDNNRLDNLIWADELNDIPVCCITTRTIYESATVAQEIDDYNPKAIVRSCNSPNQHAGILEDGTKCKWMFIPKKYYDERLKGHRVIKVVESK